MSNTHKHKTTHNKIKDYNDSTKLISCSIITELRPFQKSLEDMYLDNTVKGKIYWIFDSIGKTGKTEFIKYMNIKYKVPFSYGYKKVDIISIIFKNKNYILNNEHVAIIYDFGKNTNVDKISYSSIEQVSEGAISSSRFKNGCFIYNCPNIFILSNVLPNKNKITNSKWLIYTINNNLELIQIK